MAIHIDRIKPLRVLNTPFFLPINKSNKRYNSIIFSFTKSNPLELIFEKYRYLLVNNRLFYSYYREKNVEYFISNKGLIDSAGVVQEQFAFLRNEKELIITEDFILDGETVSFFKEGDVNDTRLRQSLYKNRIKTDKEIIDHYKEIKSKYKGKVTRAFLDIKKYKGLNLLVDMSYYLDLFVNGIYSKMRPNKSNIILKSLMERFILDNRFSDYTRKSVLIDLNDWITGDITVTKLLNQNMSANPLSVLVNMIQSKDKNIHAFDKIDFIITNGKAWFKFRTDEFENSDLSKLKTAITKLINLSKGLEEPVESEKEDVEDKATEIINRLESITGINIDSINGTTKKIDKIHEPEMVSATGNVTKVSKSAEKIADIIKDKVKEDKINLDTNVATIDDNELKTALVTLKMEKDNKVKVSRQREKRFNELNNKFLKAQIDNTPVKNLLDRASNKKLDKSNLTKIESIDNTWDGLKKPNFEKAYSLETDIMKCIESFNTNNKDIRMAVVDIKKEDTSTTEDSIDTYRVQLEDSYGKRHTLTFDVPKIEHNRFLKLRGNTKILSGQLMNLPIIKTEEDVVQVVSNYNKIFIRLNKPIGSATQRSSAIIKTLNKIIDNKYKDTDGEVTTTISKIILGNNTKISKKYILPIEYTELSKFFNKIEFKNGDIIYFNQDEIREKSSSKFDTNTIPYAIKNDRTSTGTVDGTPQKILDLLLTDPLFEKLYNGYYSSQKSAAYSEASILSSRFPLIIIMAYNVGLLTALDRAKIKYDFTEKRPNKKTTNYIKFSDGYLTYDNEISTEILMNGLYKFNTEDYSIKEIDNKQMWLDALDLFGGRFKADGLDSFYNLMMDPITVDVCKEYKLPYEYIEVLAYASSLLTSNEYNRHIDITGNRFRTNERLAHFTYKALATAYGDYLRDTKRNRKDAKMTMKRTAVIDLALQDSTMSDMSLLTPLLEMESANTVSYKGLAGMNSDRSYQLDKRTYDESMLNKLAMSTGFAANVGISRQTTINMDVDGSKGYMFNNGDVSNEMNDVNTLSITEALTPLGTTHDDPFRTAMTFIQTAKHGMRTTQSDPLLVTNGADQALPYLTSDIFSHKAKSKGKIIKKTDDYLVIRYEDKNIPDEVVDLRERVEKNSDGGFWITLKLDTDYKVGDKVNTNDIVAYDKLSFSDQAGIGNLSYNIGKLAKIAILHTDEGFEDSASISEKLAVEMGSEIVVKKEILLDKDDTIISFLREGVYILEGQDIFAYSNAVDDTETNAIIDKLITDKDAKNELGVIKIPSKVTGKIQDIKVYSTVDQKEMSPSIRKFVKAIYEKEDNFNKSTGKPITEKVLPPTGKLKHSEGKILIEYYLKYRDDLSVGDKIVYFSALKGTVKYLYPEGEEPKSEYRPEETISSMLPLGSVTNRMVASVPILVGLNKIMIELDRHVKDIMGVEYNDGLM